MSASAQVWIESGDAPSFPDGPAQVTRGAVLDTISGSTGAGDLRDAYCIRIVEPDSFLATTDPATSPTANADFDTRLFLFRSDGAPVLANDDTPPSQPPFLSTLTGSATDGSGFVLSQPGEYVLVVGGSPEDPQDPTDLNLFDIDSALDGVHAPDPAAGRFDAVGGGSPGHRQLRGLSRRGQPCQNALDVVFANIVPEQPNRSCLGDGLGGFTCSDVSTDESSIAWRGAGLRGRRPEPRRRLREHRPREESGVSRRRSGRLHLQRRQHRRELHPQRGAGLRGRRPEPRRRLREV